MKFYKIRKRSNPNLYRLAGSRPSWNKTGKTWDAIGKLRAIITNIINGKYHNYYNEDLSDWEIVEYEVTEASAKPVHEVMSQKNLLTLLSR
jgi:hypothetical protein